MEKLMKIVRLETGERAPRGSDTATITTLSDGRYAVRGFTTDRVTAPAAFHTISEKSFPNAGEAESAGIR
jgi:hypothetical protein